MDWIGSTIIAVHVVSFGAISFAAVQTSVDINVGGIVFESSRHTLTQQPGKDGPEYITVLDGERGTRRACMLPSNISSPCRPPLSLNGQLHRAGR